MATRDRKRQKSTFLTTVRDGSGPGRLVACGEPTVGGASPEVPPRVPTRRLVGNITVSCGGACNSRTHFLATGLGGLGLRRPAHLPVSAVSPHAPSKCVFQNTILQPCCVFRDALEFLPCFGSQPNSRL